MTSSSSQQKDNIPSSSSSLVTIDWDDGHIPENFTKDDGAKATTMVYDADFVTRPAVVHVVDDAVPLHLVDGLYSTTVDQQGGKPSWGTYVTVAQIQDYLQQHQQVEQHHDDQQQHCQGREALAVAAAAHFLQTAGQVSETFTDASRETTQTYCHPSLTPNGTNSNSRLWTTHDFQCKAHGVAVWALCSTENARVPYHIDYAEQIRYEHNQIVLPILAGTLQCNSSKIAGGDFCVCMDGLAHYQTHGYKGIKSLRNNTDVFDYQKDINAHWISIPYRYNRMTLTSGHLPHLSTRVQTISGHNRKRVIVGFNVFGQQHGPAVQAAPEHSDAFRRKVALQRVIQKQQTCGGGVSLQVIHANKGLSKLLVLAKREKVKRELALAQAQLDRNIRHYILQQQKQQGGVTVAALMDALGNQDGETWPSPVDVQVHIHHRLIKDADDNANNINDDQREPQLQWLRRLAPFQAPPPMVDMDHNSGNAKENLGPSSPSLVSPKEVISLV